MLIGLIISIIIIAILSYAYFHLRHRMRASSTLTQQQATAITTLQQTEQNLLSQLLTLKNELDNAIKDSVTGLVGGQIFEDRLNHAIKESQRYHFTMGLLVIDINDFRMVNDALGHEAGDSLLQQISTRLQENIRQVDSASRLSKDTFVILLNQLAKPETAAVIAQRILQSFEKSFELETHELYLTASIGIAIYPDDGEDGARWMQRAMEALAIAKEQDRNGFHFYQENIHNNSHRELAICTGLKRNTLFDELQLYFQPVINTNDESIFCMDVLPHWQPVGLDLIEPNELFYYAERQHAVNALSEWLLQAACTQFVKWQSLGFKPECLGFPVTMKQLENSRFIYRLSEILQELSINPELLLLEIKNSETPFSTEELEKSFNRLRYLGVKLCIENFGSGSFSLSQLKRFPVHYLKLDSYLSQDIVNDDPQTVAMLTSLLTLAKGLSAELIVQDVQALDQLSRLKALGYHLMQGKFFAAPMMEHEVAQKMTS